MQHDEKEIIRNKIEHNLHYNYEELNRFLKTLAHMQEHIITYKEKVLESVMDKEIKIMYFCTQKSIMESIKRNKKQTQNFLRLQ